MMVLMETHEHYIYIIYSKLFSLDNTGWNAAQNVFGEDIKHLLCSWHVHRLVDSYKHVSISSHAIL